MILALLLLQPALAMPWAPPDDQVNAFNKAVHALNADDVEKALARIDKAMAKGGDCGRCIILKARALSRLDRPEEAFDLLAPLLPDFPEEAELMGVAAAAAFASERFEDARNLALAAVTAAPGEFWTRRTLVQADLRLGAYDDARAAIEAARKHLYDLDSIACLEAELAMELEDYDAFSAALPTCRRSKQQSTADELWENYLTRTGDTAAVAAIRDSDADDSFGANLQILTLMHEERWEEADAAATKALRRFPKDSSILSNQSVIRWKLGDHEGAIDSFVQAIPFALEVTVNRKGDMSGAVTKSTEIESLQVMTANGASLILNAAADGDADAARRITQDMHSLPLSDAQTAAIDAALQSATGDFAAAWQTITPFADDAEDGVQFVIEALANGDPQDTPAWATDRIDPENLRVRLWNDSVAALNAEDYATCLSVLDEIKPGGQEITDEMVDNMRFDCAVYGGEQDRAQTLLEKLGDDGVRAGSLHDLGVELYNGGQRERGLDLMTRGCQRMEEADRPQCLDDLPTPPAGSGG